MAQKLQRNPRMVECFLARSPKRIFPPKPEQEGNEGSTFVREDT